MRLLGLNAIVCFMLFATAATWYAAGYCHGLAAVEIPIAIPASEQGSELRAALLADIDHLLAQKWWMVSDEQKRRLRAVRIVVENDPEVIEQIASKLDK